MGCVWPRMTCPGRFLQTPDFSGLENLQAALPFPLEVVGWKSPKSRGWEWQGSAAGASRAVQLWTGELSLEALDGHEEVPETSLRESPGFFP